MAFVYSSFAPAADVFALFAFFRCWLDKDTEKLDEDPDETDEGADDELTKGADELTEGSDELGVEDGVVEVDGIASEVETIGGSDERASRCSGSFSWEQKKNY